MTVNNLIASVRHNRQQIQWTLITIIATVLVTSVAEAHSYDRKEQVWVATIAVDNYPHLPVSKQLKWCQNDEEILVSRLREGNRMPLDHLCRFRSGGPRKLVPTKQNIQRELPEFLSQANADDVVIIFLSLHGARIKLADGRFSTCLLPEDTDPAKLAESCIPLSWLRDVLCARIKARRVMVIMDACHSGGIRPSDDASAEPLLPATTRDIQVTFEQGPADSSSRNVYVLTSCNTDEVSLETPDTNHGLFTHWLVCGMDGAADRNEDAVVTMDELFGFVCDMVPRSAEYYAQASAKPLTQRPQRILLGTNHEDIPLLALNPQTPETAFRRLSVGIDSVVRHSLVRIQDRPARQPLVMLAELSPEHASGMMSAEFGSFPMICREIIEDNLLERVGQLPPQFTYGVADARTMELKHRDIALTDLQEGRISNGELDAIVFGTFRREGKPGSPTDPDRLCVTIKVRHTGTGGLVGLLRTSIPIDRQFLMMFGGSSDQQFSQAPQISNFEVSEHGRPIPVPALISAIPMLTAVVPPGTLQEQSALQQEFEDDHPLLNLEGATLSVQVMQRTAGGEFTVADWNSRDPEHPNRLSFSTRKGNQISMTLQNQRDEPIAVIVQIDGINQIGRNVTAPSQSCYWSVQPHGKFLIDQWMDRPDIKPHVDSFSVSGGSLIVSDPPNSVAGRQSVTERLGEIRILVFGMKEVPKGSRSLIPDGRLGIAESSDLVSKEYPVDRSRIIDVSNPKATYVIRYFDDSNIQEMARN